MAGIVHEVENHRLVEQAEQEAAEAARELAEIIDDACPDSREKSLALTNLQQATMWANASIAINEAEA